uniref:C-type lectin domain-containing protein n=1 Tax=Acrobeloides nanus TaxID=290746 RepID=A0A914DJV0_9BILA
MDFAQAQNIPFFIGLNDQASIGIWVWDQPAGKTLTLSDTKYINWASGEPDTSDPTQRCVVDQQDIGWMVCSCELSAFSVCGKPAII